MVTEPASNASQEQDRELQIVLAELQMQREIQKASIDAVGQTLTIYLAALAIVGPVAGAIAVFTQTALVNSPMLAGLMGFAAVASIFTLFRSYQMRIQQTYAEKAITRLRRYLVIEHPHLAPYLFGSINDDWRTPFSHRWHSLTYYGWVSLCLASGVFAGAAIGAGFSSFVSVPSWAAVAAGCFGGIAVFVGTLVWLQLRLNAQRRAYQPRFPTSEPIDS